MKKTKTQRRIEICKDALSQIETKKYEVKKGFYVKLSDRLWFKQSENPEKSAQECLLNDEEQNICKVCAKGAIFVSLVRKENKVPLIDLNRDSVREEKSKELFDKKNLDLIEAVFENWTYFYKQDKEYNSDNYEGKGSYIPAIRSYYKRYYKDEERLSAILRNMIRNKGIFILPKK